jgi:hypothetical protein
MQAAAAKYARVHWRCHLIALDHSDTNARDWCISKNGLTALGLRHLEKINLWEALLPYYEYIE